ncbi:tetraacyldisaccharide 4'-kinase [Chlamydia trachomatis]|jgi:tetraacyldisaccharide 4''-kinase|uniref:Tetraacyldisaccharide 4'-kinase n=2 Tax=Chlamydia muridarum TaxID=83560 RepID=LPXK_CHLMU|nr:tetraacyldisaccharide 4'-kinase [Chlamydia muridarum]Q9PJZ4.1 RecName: Full=Tetraacyldisaccharide 4'-kinase; AltName: Full=Lipid A 4'-kinase [Chlamydia muridarum str. Nigg]UFT35836.1 tetraacyldisaccharide 4'-kinase [Chlamydia trachomatis]AAF39500.1 tetraacyldisaccharide 4`-kinase [Chlamydia muridarum str. Nigg]AHH23068.1 tetraacyldisaccharide 4'-kinase [Chlamydia muridarum str. Nigg3 CMUT3-5]AHH23993.1 tetraacyldisaccharide 4'-kinase [Chlamydia muridarum str. Nigg CM972]AID38200.1 tetraacy
MRFSFLSGIRDLFRHFIISAASGALSDRLGWVWGAIAKVFSGSVWLRYKIAKPPHQVQATVVSVGNIVVGGTGKTPLVLWLAQALNERGISCAVLSRGYKGKCSQRKSFTIVDPALHTAACVGDEPLLLAKHLPAGTVRIQKDRKALAEKSAGAFDVLLLDDGFQCNRLHKDVEIVLVNGSDPFGGRAFFPKGRLRDFPERLAKANYVIVNGKCSPSDQRELDLLNPAAKILVEPQISEIVWLNKSANMPRDHWEGLGVGVFCGLGFPKGFLTMLRNAGIHVLGTHLLPDHSGITKQELELFCKKIILRQGVGILCTEKDSVKIEAFAEEMSLPIGEVRMRFSCVCNEERMVAMLDAIEAIQKNKKVTT